MKISACSLCNQEKTQEEFYSRLVCKKCNNKRHYQKYKSYYTEKGENRRADPKLKDSLRKYNTEWTRKRRSEHIETRIKGNLRNRLRDAIKGRRKSDTTIKLLGCDWSHYQSYIESLWTDGMNWKNYGRGKGKWNIDHIKPLSLFDLTLPEEQAKAFHYLNTQPLWETENFKKGNRFGT